jgi:hypothetical protein
VVVRVVVVVVGESEKEKEKERSDKRPFDFEVKPQPPDKVGERPNIIFNDVPMVFAWTLCELTQIQNDV